jgi:hypothetical protein
MDPIVRLDALGALRLKITSIQFYTARTVLPLERVVSVLACMTMAAGNPSNRRLPATFFYSSTSGLVGKWLYDHYLKLMDNCVPGWVTATIGVLLVVCLDAQPGA